MIGHPDRFVDDFLLPGERAIFRSPPEMLAWVMSQFVDYAILGILIWILAVAENEWVSLLGPTHVVVGFGIWDQQNYMSIDEAIPTWNQVESNHPTLRGAFDWQIHIDESIGWQFASRVGPLVK